MIYINEHLTVLADLISSQESESLSKDRAGVVIARQTKVLPDGRLCIADEPIDKMNLNDANKILELPLLFTKVQSTYKLHII